MKIKPENFNSEYIYSIACGILITFLILFFVVMYREDSAKYDAIQAEARKYAEENDLPMYMQITRIRGCQYLESGGNGPAFSRTHMGDCDNPIHNAVPKPQLER